MIIFGKNDKKIKVFRLIILRSYNILNINYMCFKCTGICLLAYSYSTILAT